MDGRGVTGAGSRGGISNSRIPRGEQPLRPRWRGVTGTIIRGYTRQLRLLEVSPAVSGSSPSSPAEASSLNPQLKTAGLKGGSPQDAAGWPGMDGWLPIRWRTAGSWRRESSGDSQRGCRRVVMVAKGSGTDTLLWSSYWECLYAMECYAIYRTLDPLKYTRSCHSGVER